MQIYGKSDFNAAKTPIESLVNVVIVSTLLGLCIKSQSSDELSRDGRIEEVTILIKRQEKNPERKMLAAFDVGLSSC